MAWLDAQYEEPSRTDWYIMALIAEVRSLLAKKRVEPKEARLRFEEKPTTLTEEQKQIEARKLQASWVAGMGMAVERRTRTRAEAEALGIYVS